MKTTYAHSSTLVYTYVHTYIQSYSSARISYIIQPSAHTRNRHVGWQPNPILIIGRTVCACAIPTSFVCVYIHTCKHVRVRDHDLNNPINVLCSPSPPREPPIHVSPLQSSHPTIPPQRPIHSFLHHARGRKSSPQPRPWPLPPSTATRGPPPAPPSPAQQCSSSSSSSMPSIPSTKKARPRAKTRNPRRRIVNGRRRRRNLPLRMAASSHGWLSWGRGAPCFARLAGSIVCWSGAEKGESDLVLNFMLQTKRKKEEKGREERTRRKRTRNCFVSTICQRTHIQKSKSNCPDADCAGIGAFQEYYQHELLPSYSASNIAWIPSLQIFFMTAGVSFVPFPPLSFVRFVYPSFFISHLSSCILNILLSTGLPSIFDFDPQSLVFGTIYDRYGPRQLNFLGTLFHVSGLMMCSLGTQYYQILLAQGVCSGLGLSAILQPCESDLHVLFPSRLPLLPVPYSSSTLTNE